MSKGEVMQTSYCLILQHVSDLSKPAKNKFNKHLNNPTLQPYVMNDESISKQYGYWNDDQIQISPYTYILYTRPRGLSGS